MTVVAVAQPVPPAPQLKPYRYFCTGDNCSINPPYGLAIGDVMGVGAGPTYPAQAPDSWPDVVVVNAGVNREVVIFANTGAYGTWNTVDGGLVRHTAIPLTTNYGPYLVRLSDLDADGDRDIVVSLDSPPTHFTAPKLATILNNGDGTFGAATFLDPTYITAKPGAPGLTVAEITGSHGPDFLVSGADPELNPIVELFKHDPGQLTFTSEAYYPDPQLFTFAGHNAASIFATQVDSLSLDHVTTSTQVSSLFARIRIGSPPGYAEYTIPDVGAPAFGAAPAWLRTGRVRDVAMSDWSSNALVVSKSNGAGSFVKQSFQITSGYFQPFGVAAGRVNDDNTVDVAVVCQSGQEGDGGLVLEMNYGSDPLQFAEYAYPLDPTIHDKPCFVEIGDLNRDTRNDIAVTANSSYRLYVWLNNLPPPPTDGN